VCGIVNDSVNLETAAKSIEFAEKYDFMYAAVGFHPENIENMPENYLDSLAKLCEHKKVVAIGETGLDYHWDTTPREMQLEAFEKQLILANQLSLSVIIHDREAHEDTMKLLKKYKPEGVLHCFSGSAEMAKEVLKLGMYIGLGGVVTFKNARKSVEVAEMIPTERLLLETDCPYMAPVPFRGKRCDSSLIAYTAKFIANLKGMDTQELINNCNINAKTLFNINKTAQ
jgi:TatD DNase family protein